MCSMQTPDPLDAHIGRKLRERRTLMGWSQEKLSEALGLSFQQIQKYENGANRIVASRLFQVGKLLKVPVHFFFEGYTNNPGGAAMQVAEETHNLSMDVLEQRETLELVRAYYQINDSTVRRKVLDMVKSLSHDEPKAKEAAAAEDPS